jgi:hypothetical protein
LGEEGVLRRLVGFGAEILAAGALGDNHSYALIADFEIVIGAVLDTRRSPCPR